MLNQKKLKLSVCIAKIAKECKKGYKDACCLLSTVVPRIRRPGGFVVSLPCQFRKPPAVTGTQSRTSRGIPAFSLSAKTHGLSTVCSISTAILYSRKLAGPTISQSLLCGATTGKTLTGCGKVKL